jgi:L-fuculose-phosphate aldolase
VTERHPVAAGSDPVEVRHALVRAARELLAKGLTVGTAGNLSARMPDGTICLTPSSLPYDTMTIDDLVVCDLDGTVLDGTRNPTSEKSLHLECFRLYDHVGAVIHCHPIYATMFAVTHQPIPAVIEEFIVYVGGDVPCAPYRQTGSDDLGRAVAKALDGKHATLMANHGLLACGANPDKALHTAELVERTAQVMWGARAMGEIVQLPEETKTTFGRYYEMIRDNPRP